jgi:hypothetical protein
LNTTELSTAAQICGSTQDNLSTNWRYMVTFTLQPLYPLRKCPRYPSGMKQGEPHRQCESKNRDEGAWPFRESKSYFITYSQHQAIASPNTVKANSHIPCRSPAMSRPCRSPAMSCRLGFKVCLFHLIYTVRPCLIHTCHAASMPRDAMSRPCRSESDFSRPRHSTAWAWHRMC